MIINYFIKQNKLKLATDLDSSNDAIVRVNAYIVELLWRDSEVCYIIFNMIYFYKFNLLKGNDCSISFT
jgi:hypothetical protein